MVVPLHVVGTNNTISMNDLVANGVNCRNDGEDNTYDCNYWSDYTGTDSDGNGIGDTPYDIQGNVQSEDPHPRMSCLSGNETIPVPLDITPFIIVTAAAIVIVLAVVVLRRR